MALDLEKFVDWIGAMALILECWLSIWHVEFWQYKRVINYHYIMSCVRQNQLTTKKKIIVADKKLIRNVK